MFDNFDKMSDIFNEETYLKNNTDLSFSSSEREGNVSTTQLEQKRATNYQSSSPASQLVSNATMASPLDHSVQARRNLHTHNVSKKYLKRLQQDNI